MYLGQWESGGSYRFNGSIDEARVWNRSLSAAEISQIYMSNLYKYNSTQWYLYVNQSKNATAGLDDGNYTYRAFASDVQGNSNSSEQNAKTVDTSKTDIHSKIRFVSSLPESELRDRAIKAWDFAREFPPDCNP